MLKERCPDKPTQIWTQGETESSSCWFPTIDKPNQKQLKKFILRFLNNMLPFLTVLKSSENLGKT